jgi:hypothetical protein
MADAKQEATNEEDGGGDNNDLEDSSDMLNSEEKSVE